MRWSSGTRGLLLAALLATPVRAGSGVVVGSGGGRIEAPGESAAILTLGQPLAGAASSGESGVGLGFLAGFTYGGMTPVDLAAFRVLWTPEGVEITWTIAGEPIDHAGFHVYRQVEEGPRERITGSLIRGKTSYRHLDAAPPAGSVSYWLAEVGRSGGLTWYGPVTLDIATAGTPRLALLPGRPNPFRASTRVPFQVPAGGRVKLRVFDSAGRQVAVLLDAVLEPGAYEATWDARDTLGTRVASGVYFTRLRTRQGALTRKLLVLP